MKNTDKHLHIFHILREDAIEIQQSLFGSVGKIFSGEGIEAVWVKKQSEEEDDYGTLRYARNYFHQSKGMAGAHCPV